MDELEGLDAEFETVHMSLTMNVTEDGETASIALWAGTATEWLFEGPHILQTLALAVAITQRRQLKESDTDLDED